MRASSHLPCRSLLFLVCLFFSTTIYAESPASSPSFSTLPQPSLSYRIQVRIDPESRTFEGSEILTWKNLSQSTISSIPIHLYLNAFAHEGSTWMREVKDLGFSSSLKSLKKRVPDPWGFIEPIAIEQQLDEPSTATQPTSRATSLKSTWKPIQPDDENALDRSLIQVVLPRAIAPQETLKLHIRFKGRLPVPIARTGCVTGFCFVAQWFPKIGVLELPGVRHATEPRWAARQFHAATEFYAEFANFDVTIDAPEGWIVGATGKEQQQQASTQGYSTFRYTQTAVHDFAFVVAKNFEDIKTSLSLSDRTTPIELRVLFPPSVKELYPRMKQITEQTLELFGTKLAPYPYDTLTIVLPPPEASRTSGMEYPTLITGSTGDPLFTQFPLDKNRIPEVIAAHEIGHQYFYGIIASNEQEEAFLDEGFNSYWESRLLAQKTPNQPDGGTILGRALDLVDMRAYSMAQKRDKIREAVRTIPAALYYPGSHFAQIYGRTAMTFHTASALFGEALVDKLFSTYYRRYRFQHPDVDDFLEVAHDVAGASVVDFFKEAFSQPSMPDYRVVEISAKPFLAPIGYPTTKNKTWHVTAENQRDLTVHFVDAQTHASGNNVWVEITDPGWYRDDATFRGATYRRALTPLKPSPSKANSTKLTSSSMFESTAFVEGPGWTHLPVEVALHFSDGVVLHDTWHGNVWRRYRIVREAKLHSVYLDPKHKLKVDVFPQNNSRTIEPNQPFSRDWTSWLVAVTQWFSASLTLWL